MAATFAIEFDFVFINTIQCRYPVLVDKVPSGICYFGSSVEHKHQKQYDGSNASQTDANVIWLFATVL